jgi:dTDP-4-dehydrorhamnose 3,5-epimerase-like enzyme
LALNRKGIILVGDSGTEYSAQEPVRCIGRDNPAIGIQWPIERGSLLSAKVQQGKPPVEAENFA